MDQGRWPLAWLLSHQPEPVWSDLSRQPPQDSLSPFTPLAHPTWVAAAVGLMRDMEVWKAHNARVNPQPPKGGYDPKAGGKGGKNTKPPEE